MESSVATGWTWKGPTTLVFLRTSTAVKGWACNTLKSDRSYGASYNRGSHEPPHVRCSGSAIVFTTLEHSTARGSRHRSSTRNMRSSSAVVRTTVEDSATRRPRLLSSTRTTRRSRTAGSTGRRA
ncbi:unnamed protein product [Rangifer tarandus platyrhynchus]|uniref:Uncharacterized protein n=1 Tax=Rangifer tarandus platyrhynchus TaxID=3082113 RepID=A0ABN8XMT1_RANTA|nr:unnamed protein product [Rangifer tarandus platyrhynchus]